MDWPLAVMDYRTLGNADVYPTVLLRERFELRGETVSICYNESQKWYYLSHQTTDEVTLIKIWDSDGLVSKSE